MEEMQTPTKEIHKMEKILSEAKIIILDIEGTTTSIHFVRDLLIPYAEANYENFIKDNWTDESIKTAVAHLVKFQADHEKEEGFIPLPLVPEKELNKEFLEKLILHLKWQRAHGIQTHQMKFLQGLIWIKGFNNKEIEGHVYDDVPVALRKWRDEGKKIFIYSNGTVESQKLLFKHSHFGDLENFIDGHFDSSIGQKTNSESYKIILKEINASPNDVVYFTDRPKEAYAAKCAGLKVILMSRDPNPYIESEIEYIDSKDAMVPSFILEV